MTASAETPVSFASGRLPAIVATDLDGTLLRSDHTISPYTHHVLREIRAAGVEVVAVTGRGPRLRSLTARTVLVARYLVCAQGAYVLDLATHEVLHVSRLPAATAREAVQMLEEAVGPVLVTVESGDADGAPLHGETGFGWPFAEAWAESTRDAMFDGELLKVFVMKHDMPVDELLRAARQVVPAGFVEVTYAGFGFLELCPTGVTKAAGLEVVAGRLGVPPDAVLAFGDMPNDVPMFGWAQHGVAVANAHDELIAVADELTLTNDEDGVARYLQRLLR